jgi:hypothetical protein
MTDDSFIREVNEEYRKDQAMALWERYGVMIAVLAVLIVLGTAAFVGYRYWASSRANAAGDAFSAALQLAQDGKSDEALAAFAGIEKNGYGDYPVLARMRAATVKANKGDVDGAVKDFDAVAADTSVPDPIRDMARLRAGLLLVDHGSYADVAARVESLTDETNPLRNTAREALALSAWKAGKNDDALKLFDQINADDAASRNARERATMMADLIRGGGAS